MEIIAGTTDFYLEKDTAVAIGKFDGVHLGHRRLLEEILNKKKNGLAACVFTFDPTPAVLFGLSDGKELTTREEKRRLFEHLGIDILIEFPLTKETAATEPERFVTEILAKQMNTRFVAAGEDLSFGKNGAGNAELLEKMAPHLGFCVRTIEKIEVDGIEVSSTYIRKLVEEGKPSAYETFIGTFPTEMGRPGGYAVDCNDDYAYITVEREGTEEEKERMMKNAFLPESNQPVKIKPTLCGIRKMNLSTGEVTKVIDTEFKTGHIQASRFTRSNNKRI